MTSLETNAELQASGLSRIWQRTPVAVRAIVQGFLVNTIGVMGVPVIAATLPLPFAFPAMLIYLFVFWMITSGRWGPKASAASRKRYFRVGKLSPELWKWSLLVIGLAVLAWQSSLVVTFRLIEYPAELFKQEYSLDALPLWAAWVAIVIAAFSAGLCEEAGFRGYGLVPLEERYGPLVGNLSVAAFFVVAHLEQAWSPPLLIHLFVGSLMFGAMAYTSGSLIPGIIAHTILDIFNFSYWWSDVAGKFEYQTIANTGVDLHFVIWTLIFVTSAGLFIWGVRKMKSVRLQS